MKVLRIHAPGTDRALADALTRAVVAFNRGLDIRLRFLSIGIEEQVLDVADAADAAERVARALSGGGVEVVVLLGHGPAALAAAAATIRARASLVRVDAGRRDGSDADASRAVDRLANVLLAHGQEHAARLAEEGVAGTVLDVGRADEAATGDRVVRALARARRTAAGGG